MPRHWEAREKKIEKRRSGMRVTNRGIFVVRDNQKKRDKRILKDREQKSELSFAT